jgi:hypothetical protein
MFYLVASARDAQSSRFDRLIKEKTKSGDFPYKDKATNPRRETDAESIPGEVGDRQLSRGRPAQKIFRVGFVGHPFADEIAQPGSFFRDDFGDLTVLIGHRGDARRLVHPLL